MKVIRFSMSALFALALALLASTAWAGERLDRPDLMDIREAGNVIYDSNDALEWDAFSSDNDTANRMSMFVLPYGAGVTAAGYFTGMTGNFGLSSWTDNDTKTTWYSGDQFDVQTHWYWYDPTSEWSGAVVDWWIFEPDLVKRSSQKTVVLQRAYLGFEVALGWHIGEGEAQNPPYESSISGVWYYGSIESCGAAVMAKDLTPDNDPSLADAENCPDFAVWAVACRQPIADVLATLRDYVGHGEPGNLIEPAVLARVLELVGRDFSRRTLVGSDGDHVCDPLDDEKYWMWGEGTRFPD